MRTKLETKRVKTVTSLLSWMGGWDGWYRRRSVLLTATHPVPRIVFTELWNSLHQSPEIIRTNLLCSAEFTVLYILFDRFLLAVESCDLSQADNSIIRVSSFPS